MMEEVFGHADTPPTKDVPIAERAKYFGHFDSRIRRMAAYSLMREGQAAMPHIIKALQSDDVRVIRAGCDAIAGSFGMNGLGKGNYRKQMTPDVAGGAVPYLLPLLKHEDMYVREGVLMALSNCGAAAAKHLDKIVALADDDDWWVRAGVAYVLRYVVDPATGEHAGSTIANFLAEQSTFGKNRFRNALTEMARRDHATEAIVKALIIEAKEEDGGAAVTALSEIGPNAKAALPIFEERRASAQARADNAKNDDEKKRCQKYADNWERIIERTKGPN
jgi:HEAT repeat protein